MNWFQESVMLIETSVPPTSPGQSLTYSTLHSSGQQSEMMGDPTPEIKEVCSLTIYC